MFVYYSLVKGVEEPIRGHTQCSGISEKGVGEEEPHSTNVAKAVGNVANGATVRLEEIPSHSSNMKNIVEDSGLGGCSSRLNNIPRKYQRRREEDLPGEGIEPAIGTPGKHFSNPEVNTKSSETKNLPHHPMDQPTLAFVDYIRVSEFKEEKPKNSSSVEETDWEDSLDQPSPEVVDYIRILQGHIDPPYQDQDQWNNSYLVEGMDSLDALVAEVTRKAEQGGEVTGENSEGDPLPTCWPPVKKRKKKRILKTSRTDQEKIERSMQEDAITDNNVWEDKSKKEVTTNSEIPKERKTATEDFLDECAIQLRDKTEKTEDEPQEKEATRGDIWKKNMQRTD